MYILHITNNNNSYRVLILVLLLHHYYYYVVVVLLFGGRWSETGREKGKQKKMLWIYCPVGTLDCDFRIDSLQIFRGSIKTHISPFHTSTARPWGYNEHNQNIIINLFLQLTYFYDFDLVSDLLWPFVPHDLQTLCFSVKNIVLQWTQSKDNYKSSFFNWPAFTTLT